MSANLQSIGTAALTQVGPCTDMTSCARTASLPDRLVSEWGLGRKLDLFPPSMRRRACGIAWLVAGGADAAESDAAACAAGDQLDWLHDLFVDENGVWQDSSGYDGATCLS